MKKETEGDRVSVKVEKRERYIETGTEYRESVCERKR